MLLQMRSGTTACDTGGQKTCGSFTGDAGIILLLKLAAVHVNINNYYCITYLS